MPIRNATTTTSANAIAALDAGTVFNFSSPVSDNNGLAVRVKDSQVGKGRFVNLESGKLLTSVGGDNFTEVPAGTTLVTA